MASGVRRARRGAAKDDRPRPADRESRDVAVDGFEAVFAAGQSLEEALDALPDFAALADRDRAFVRNLLATTLRHLGQIDWLIDGCLERPLPRAAARARTILRLGICQLLFLDVPDHAAVNTAVLLCRRLGAAPFAALVNAVLRRIAAEGRQRLSENDDVARNTPPWLWQRWCTAYGEPLARAIADSHLAQPPLDLTARDDPKAVAAAVGGRVLATGSVRLAHRGRIEALPGYEDGAWWVQDAAATLPARLFGPLAGLTIVDLCAAPGGKTAQLAAGGASVMAVDRQPARIATLSANLARLRMAAATVVADATQWRPPAPVDGVLVDAPCSATGTIRRHPDIPWTKRPADIARLSALQADLLAAGAAMLREGGILVYCTCSLEPEEGPAIVAARLAADPGLERVPLAPSDVGGFAELISPDGDLRTLPCHWRDEGGLDGFYAARLRRRTAPVGG